MRIIPFPIHIVLDYLFAIILISFPVIVGHFEVDLLTLLPPLLGLLIIVINIVTEGVKKRRRALSVRTHLWLDSIMGSILIVVGLVFRHGPHAWLGNIIIGGLFILLAIISENTLPNEFKYYS